MAVADAYFSSVTALLHFESSFVDVKGHPFNPTGGPVIDTVSPLVGVGSYFASTAGKYLTSPASADWDMGSADFCVEGKASASSVSGIKILMTGRTGSGSDRGPTVFVTDGSLRGFCGDGSGLVFADCIGGTVVVNTPFSWAYSRIGNTFRLFLNGALVASATSSAACGGGTELTIGRDPGTVGREWVGRIDEVRRTRGAGRYSAAYTPISGPFPDSEFVYSLSGNVKDATGSNAARLVRAYREDTGALAGSAASNGTTGNYSIDTAYSGAHTLVFYPAGADAGLVALVLRGVIPV